MTEQNTAEHSAALAAARDEGRRLGLATAALAMAIVSFINLLGVEKSLLAVVLGLLALRGSNIAGAVRNRSRVALILGTLHLLTVLLVLILFREELSEFLAMLYELN